MLIAPMKQDLGLYSGHNHVIETSSSLQCRNPIHSNIVKQLLQPPPSCGVFLNKSNQRPDKCKQTKHVYSYEGEWKISSSEIKDFGVQSEYCTTYDFFNLAIHSISLNKNFTSRELEVLTRRQVLKVASLNMSGRQLLNASQALF